MTIHDMASVFLTSYLKIEGVNQKSGSNIFLVSTHSACPYKNYGLECFPESQTLIIYLVFSFFHTKQKKKQKVLKSVVEKLQKFKGCFDQIWLPVMRMAFIYNQSPLQHLIAQNFKVA